MIGLRPTYVEFLETTSDRTARQLLQLGVDRPADVRVVVRIQLRAGASWSRQLLARMLVDYLVRLEPLVGAVWVDADGDVVGDLPQRFPVVVEEGHAPPPDIAVVVGADGDGDLVVDAAGWVSGVGALVDVPDDRNPIGAMATAALGAAEIFKLIFQHRLPDLPFTAALVPHRGLFSFLTYGYGSDNMTIGDITLEATLVGAGGVGATVVVALAELGQRLRGRLDIVDGDALTIDNLNRVLYATLAGATAGALKARAAAAYASRRVPHLKVVASPTQYITYARNLGPRAQRSLPLVITGLDDDEYRWQVQRDLPRDLVDAATGSHGNLRVERVAFGRAGCLGCSRPPLPKRQDEQCDVPPDEYAPSISFLSGLAGTLAAGEAIKLALYPELALVGYFEHIVLYPANADQGGLPAVREDCPVACSTPNVIAAYREKWTQPHRRRVEPS